MNTSDAVAEYLRRKRQPVDFTGQELDEVGEPAPPEPLALRERPQFDSMLEGEAPAINERRLQNEAELDGRRAVDDMLSDMAGRGLGHALPPPPGADGGAGGMRPDPRPPLSPKPLPTADDGSGGPMGYLAALRRAQRMDDLSAAVGRSNAAMQQLANVTSRGVFQPRDLAPMPSEVSKEEKRRQVVLDYLKQQREDASSAADIRLKNAHAKLYETPRTPQPPRVDPLLDDKRTKIQNEADAAKALAEARRRAPGMRASKSEKPARDMAGEKQAEYDRRLKEGIPAGWELQPGAQPTQKQREEAAKLTISREMVNDSIGQVRELLKTPGAVANPRVRDLLAQQGQFIQTQLRVLEDLGVPSGPDAKILETLIGSPASIVGEALDTTQQKLDALGKYVGKRVDTTASTYGLQRKGTAAPAASAAAPAGKVKVSNGTQTLLVDAQDVPKALQKGFKVVP